MKLLNFNVIRLLTALVFGILWGHSITSSLTSTAWILSISVTIFLLAYKLSHGEKRSTLFFQSATYLFFMALGFSVMQLNNDTFYKGHYSKSLQHDSLCNITLTIKERLKPNNGYSRYYADVIALNKKPTHGRVLCLVQKDSLRGDFFIDQSITTYGLLNEIDKPKNPYEFDYRRYLTKRQVLHQVFISNNQLLFTTPESFSIKAKADRFRYFITQKLQSIGLNNEVLSLTKAILLGQKQDIEKSVYQDYVNAGVIHILAVSGLHIGIILLILNRLFKPLLRLKYGKIIKPILASLIYF